MIGRRKQRRSGVNPPRAILARTTSFTIHLHRMFPYVSHLMGSFWFSALDVWVVSAPVGSSKLMESVQLDIWSKSDPKESKETAESTIIPLYLTAYSHIQSHIDGLFNGGFLKTEYPQIIHFCRFSLRNQLFLSNPIYGNPQMMPHPSTHHEISGARWCPSHLDRIRHGNNPSLWPFGELAHAAAKR